MGKHIFLKTLIYFCNTKCLAYKYVISNHLDDGENEVAKGTFASESPFYKIIGLREKFDHLNLEFPYFIQFVLKQLNVFRIISLIRIDSRIIRFE